MTFDEYQKLARRTSSFREGPPFSRPGLSMSALGLAGEAGEVADYLKKVLYHDHPLEVERLAKELGDVLWYVAEAASTCGLSLDRVAELNVEKLRKRYPDGFNPERSMTRADDDL